MHVENITSNAMSLDRNGQSMLIQVYEKEIDRLNNIIDELSKDVDIWNRKYNEQFDIINELESYLEQQWLDWKDDYDDGIVAMANEDKTVLDKLKALKENNKDV